MTDVESVIDEVEKQLTVKMIKQVKKDKENGKKEIITMGTQRDPMKQIERWQKN